MLALLALAASTLSACTPTPEPTPTPTAAFASEEEAFAAAEEVYRAYNDALSQVDTSDPDTFEPLYALTTGGVNEADRESFSKMHAEGYVVSGKTQVIDFKGISASPERDEVVAITCLDVSDVAVVNSAGVSQVNPTRPDTYALELTFISQFDDQLLLDSAKPIEDPTCEA
ncbi:hypothetical protein [Microbacterium sp. KRD172]|uniref:hypothetical protein n=1 Tax=Microbacterium sp. KRD172 TaxID=2729727 RepID=UPI0019D0510A|nr:hypothetical protein [Microbacterium sp. KRD172]